jgi:glycosyltransferase involved in cell wall biosynthesis
MRIALIQDWLTEFGGAEKVFESILKLYPQADIYTLTSMKEVTVKLGIDKSKLKESFISKLPFGRTKYRNYLQLFPKAIESFDLSEYDIIISSSYSVAKGVITNSNQLHICFCHSPVRYAWDLYHQYLNESNLDGFSLKGLYARHVLHKLRIWDVISANRVDFFIANSAYIKRRIEKVYRRDSVVIYPPVDLSRFQLHTEKENFYFTASRLVPYKKIDLIVNAFAQMSDKKLVVAGTGPDMKKIKSIKAPNVELIGYVADDKMVDLMQKAKAFVFAADEDFGIVPVEAQACGTPVICLGIGGTKETVINGKTGVHFYEQSENALINAVHHFEKQKDDFDPVMIRHNADRFGIARFEDDFYKFVSEKFVEFNNSNNL